MTQTRLWVAATIIALIIVFGFVFSVPHTRRDVRPVSESLVAATTTPSVSLHDVFKKGVHTFTGSLVVLNACISVTVNASLVGTASTTESILLAIAAPADSGICLQEPTTVHFTTTLAAPAHLPITAMVNNVLATTTSI